MFDVRTLLTFVCKFFLVASRRLSVPFTDRIKLHSGRGSVSSHRQIQQFQTFSFQDKDILSPPAKHHSNVNTLTREKILRKVWAKRCVREVRDRPNNPANTHKIGILLKSEYGFKNLLIVSLGGTFTISHFNLRTFFSFNCHWLATQEHNSHIETGRTGSSRERLLGRFVTSRISKRQAPKITTRCVLFIAIRG